MSLESYTDDQLREELERRENEANAPPPMVKIPNFDKLKEIVTDYVEDVAENGEMADDDTEHYIYEAVMEAFYGKDYWDWHNNRCG